MKNKAQIFGIEFWIKVILAVIGILLLLFMLSQFYSIYKAKGERERAEAQLKNIVEIVNSLGDAKSEQYEVTNPNNWYLKNFDKKEICFCPEKYRNEAECRNKGVCGNTNFDINIGEIKIEGIIRIYFNRQGGVVSIRK